MSEQAKIRMPSGKVLRAEVVRSSRDQAVGLLKHSSLQDDEAMLFPYSWPTDVTFHTVGMVFPIDIVILKKVKE